MKRTRDRSARQSSGLRARHARERRGFALKPGHCEVVMKTGDVTVRGCAGRELYVALRSFEAQVAEVVDALDSGSSGHYGRGGSSPLLGTSERKSRRVGKTGRLFLLPFAGALRRGSSAPPVKVCRQRPPRDESEGLRASLDASNHGEHETPSGTGRGDRKGSYGRGGRPSEPGDEGIGAREGHRARGSHPFFHG